MAHDTFNRFIYNEFLQEEKKNDKHSESITISHEHTGKSLFKEIIYANSLLNQEFMRFKRNSLRKCSKM